MSRTNAILRFAEKMVENELTYHQEHHPELLATLPASELEAFKKGERIKAHSLADEIEDKKMCFLANQRGRFHNHNKASRDMFVEITGIELPSTNSGTEVVVRTYCGEIGNKVEAEQVKERETKETKENEERIAEQLKADRHKAALSARVAANKQIDGFELVDLCQMLGIELHPRTIGMIRKRVQYINADSASTVRGGGPMSQLAFVAYRQCVEAVSQLQSAT